jgi:hypothetical protein
MPNLNRTGPNGKGSMSGRGKGRCKDVKTTQTEISENQTPENKEVDAKRENGGKGRGLGRRNGFGRNHTSNK